MFLVLGSFVSALLGISLSLLSLFLILLVLVQRGRGGGLTGALGGPGGQSAFGTKAGDMFTRITSVVALVWIALCAFTMWLMGNGQELGAGLRVDQPAVEAVEQEGGGTDGLGGAGATTDFPELGLDRSQEESPAGGAEGPSEEAAPVGATEEAPPVAPPANENTPDGPGAPGAGEASDEPQAEAPSRDS